MKITMRDGIRNTLLDVETFNTYDVRLNQHAMRYHVYDPAWNVAVDQFHTDNKTLQAAIMAVSRYSVDASKWYGTCLWIDVDNSYSRELWNATKYRLKVEADLESYWGKGNVEVTGCAIRKIRYVSDGSLSSTPDAIGVFKGMPLIYEGPAVASIFKIHGIDVLRESHCVTYSLTRDMWVGFHSRRRGVPKDYPGEMGFVCSNWCQRDHIDKGSHISLASMTQGQTVGSWTISNLPMRSGTLAQKLTGRALAREMRNVRKSAMDSIRMTADALNWKLPRLGLDCPACGTELRSPWGHCDNCGSAYTPYYILSHNLKFCMNCGILYSMCKCGSPTPISPGSVFVRGRKKQIASMMEGLNV